MAETVTLKQICEELKIDRRDAREILRLAAKKNPEIAKAHKPRMAWQWAKGSEGEKAARAALKS